LAEILLQLADMAPHGRLGLTQHFRGPAQGAGTGDREKDSKIVPIHASAIQFCLETVQEILLAKDFLMSEAIFETSRVVQRSVTGEKNMRSLSPGLALGVGLFLTAQAEAAPFRFAGQQDVATMDPYMVDETFTTNFLAAIYEPLVRRGRALEIEPGLAARWEQMEPNRWRFHLRPDVTFTDGTRFTSGDVVFSLERARKPGSNMVNRVANIAAVAATDPLTVEITTRGADPTLLANLSAVLIMPKTWAEVHGAADPISLKDVKETYAAQHAIGTGPFILTTREAGTRTVLQANPGWWDNLQHNLDTVTYTPILSNATRVAALLSGEVDMIDPVPLQDQVRVKGAPDLMLMAGPELRVVFLGMDQFRPELLYSDVKGKNPFKDIRVRQAFYDAIDVWAIKDRVMAGQSQPVAQIAASGIVGYDADLPPHAHADIDAARKLMAEAGYADGFKLDMNCPAGRYVNDERICQSVASMLARINVKLNVVTQPPALFFGRTAKRDTSFYMLGTTPPTYDAYSTVFGLMVCPADLLNGRPGLVPGGGAFNASGYCDPETDQLTAAAASEFDTAKRNKDFAQIWRRLVTQVGYIPLHQQGLSWGVRKGISLVQRPDDVLDLRFVRMP
jgi:peptide/nickel transport system substrate-binding protein